MNAPNGTLGQLVAQLTLDNAPYRQTLGQSKADAKVFGREVERAGSRAGESMRKLGAHTGAARREIIVMAHEVVTGNWKNLGSSFMVFAEQADLLSAAMSPLGVGLGIVGAGVVALGVAAYKGAQEVGAFNRSIQLTGNYAGQTTSSIEAMAAAVAQSSGASVGQARAGLQALISTGRVTGNSLQLLGQDVIRLHELSGQNLDAIAQDFAKMGDGVARWAAEHNRSMHFMTTAEYEHIHALEDAGDRQSAMLEVAKLLDNHIRDTSLENLGALQRALRGVASAYSSVVEWAKSFGKAETAADRVASARADVKQVEDFLRNRPGTLDSGALDAARARLAAAEAAAGKERAEANRKADEAAKQERGIAASDYLKRLREQEKGLRGVSKALDEYKRKVADYNKANPASPVSAKQQAQDITLIRQQYSDRSGVASVNRVRRSLLDAALQDTRNSLDLIQSAHTHAADRLQALHKATLISDQAFYDAEITLASDSADQQIAAYEREKTALQAAYWKAPADERIRITKEMGRVDTQIAKVREENASREVVLLTQQEEAQRRYLKSISDTHDALLAQAGVSTPKALHDYDERNRGALLQAATTGDVSGAAFIDQNRQLTKLSAQYDDILAQAKRAERKISLAQREGLTGWIDGLSQMRANSAETVSSLQQLYESVDRLSWQTTDEGVLRNLDDMRDRIRESMLDSGNYLKEFTDVGREAFSGLFQDIALGTKRPADAVRSMVANMLASLSQLFVNKAIAGLVGSLFGGLTSAGGMGGNAYGFTMPSSISGSGALFGVGAGMQFASGGLITGPGSGRSDSILIRASNGEFVVREDVVSKPGVLSMLEALNRNGKIDSIPKFAAGGPVGQLASRTRASSETAEHGVSISVSTPVYIQSDGRAGGDHEQARDASGLADMLRARVLDVIHDQVRPGGAIYNFVKNGR